MTTQREVHLQILRPDACRVRIVRFGMPGHPLRVAATSHVGVGHAPPPTGRRLKHTPRSAGWFRASASARLRHERARAPADASAAHRSRRSAFARFERGTRAPRAEGCTRRRRAHSLRSGVAPPRWRVPPRCGDDEVQRRRLWPRAREDAAVFALRFIYHAAEQRGCRVVRMSFEFGREPQPVIRRRPAAAPAQPQPRDARRRAVAEPDVSMSLTMWIFNPGVGTASSRASLNAVSTRLSRRRAANARCRRLGRTPHWMHGVTATDSASNPGPRLLIEAGTTMSGIRGHERPIISAQLLMGAMRQ